MDSNTKTSKSILTIGSINSLVESLFPGGTGLSSVAFLLYLTPYLLQAVGDTFKTQFISSVEIKAHDEVFSYVMSWVAKNKLSRNNHRLLASSSMDQESFSFMNPSPPTNDDEADDTLDDVDPMASLDELRSKISLYNARPLHWTPSVGTHFFMYEGRFISFTRSIEEGESSPFARRPERIEISCLGRNADVLKRIIYNARLEYLEKQRGRTSIYRAVKSYGDELGWTKCMSKPTRPMSTIALDEAVKQSLIKDLSRYLNPRTKNWYATRGIPYRRGYLFSGPPGTGKTSLTLAAAGLMGLNIYMISLSSPNLSEDSLATLFRDLPRTCLVLLEDIDAAGLTNSRKKQEAKDKEAGPPKPQREPISLSGLLNVIDGVGAQEGRVLVMTSNHTENIDPALLRPGRVDFSVNFGLASSDTIAQLFKLMYGTSYDEVGSIEQAVTETPEKAVVTTKSIAVLAEEFTRQVPPFVFSPAAIQGYLLMHQDEPLEAVDAVETWVEEQQRLKREMSDEAENTEDEEKKSETPEARPEDVTKKGTTGEEKKLDMVNGA